MKPNQKLTLFVTSIMLLILCACNNSSISQIPKSSPIPPTKTTTPIPVSTKSIEPTVIASITSVIESTPTEWLPYNPKIMGATCDFATKVSVNEVKGLSKEGLAKRLFEIFLSHFHSQDIDNFCRLYKFKVDKTYLDDRIFFLVKEQHVDYVIRVIYSVQIKEVPSSWVAGNGEFSPSGWIIKKSEIIGITKVNNQYILKLIGTGP